MISYVLKIVLGVIYGLLGNWLLRSGHRRPPDIHVSKGESSGCLDAAWGEQLTPWKVNIQNTTASDLGSPFVLEFYTQGHPVFASHPAFIKAYTGPSTRVSAAIPDNGRTLRVIGEGLGPLKTWTLEIGLPSMVTEISYRIAVSKSRDEVRGDFDMSTATWTKWITVEEESPTVSVLGYGSRLYFSVALLMLTLGSAAIVVFPYVASTLSIVSMKRLYPDDVTAALVVIFVAVYTIGIILVRPPTMIFVQGYLRYREIAIERPRELPRTSAVSPEPVRSGTSSDITTSFWDDSG